MYLQVGLDSSFGRVALPDADLANFEPVLFWPFETSSVSLEV